MRSLCCSDVTELCW